MQIEKKDKRWKTIRNGEREGWDVMTVTRGWVEEEDENEFLQGERKREKRAMSFQTEIKWKEGGWKEMKREGKEEVLVMRRS